MFLVILFKHATLTWIGAVSWPCLHIWVTHSYLCAQSHADVPSYVAAWGACNPKRHQVWLWLVSAILPSTSWNLTRLRGPDLMVRYIMARLNCYVGPPRSNPTGKIAMQQVKFPWAMHRRDIRGLKIGLILVAGCNFAKRLKRNVAMMLWGVQYNFPALTSVGLNKCDNNRSSRLPPIAWPCLLVTCDYPVNT